MLFRILMFGGAEFWQTVAPPAIVAFGVGLTDTLNETGNPEQPFAFGTMVNVAVPVMGVKAGIAATPFRLASPIAAPPEMSKRTPAGVPVKTYGSDNTPLQNVRPIGATATGTGLTVMVKVFAGPSQVIPPLVRRGVTVIVATTGCVPLFIPVNGIILPVPLAARPMDGSLFVQV